MSFFGSLKKSIKTISDEMAELKKVKPEFLFFPEIVDPTPNILCLEPEEIKKKHSEMETKIRNIRIATSKVKINLKHKQDIQRSYFYDIEDLFLDILDEYKGLEKKLVRFGYCPLEKSSSEEDEDLNELSSNLDSNDDSMNKQQITKSVTPKLAIKKYLSVSTPELHLTQEKINKTPELCLEEKPKMLIKSSSTDIRKKTKKYGEVARRLDF